ncbi:hypothetical protein M0R01_00010 [bacterium]|nr:hypothetical protein [bacterium]
MKVKVILAMFIAIILVSIPCLADNGFFPYSMTKNPVGPYLEKTTADCDLFEFGPTDGWRVNFDKQRQEFKTIGICSYPNGTLEEINAMAKAKIYETRFTSNSTEPYIKGLTAHSLHFDKDGKETFIPFHYIVFPDGYEEEIFSDPLIKVNCIWTINQIPWAMGNWTINCQSIVIAALGDGNLTQMQVKTIRERISKLQDIKSDATVKSRLTESQTNLIQ